MKLKILRHSFHKIDGLTSRHLVNSTSDKNTLKCNVPNHTAEGKNKALVATYKIHNKIAAPDDNKSKNIFDKYVQPLSGLFGLNM